MAGGKKGGSDMVLESRHVAGIFLGVVVLCGVFFTLGFVMGRTQYDGSSGLRNPGADRPRGPVTAAVPEEMQPALPAAAEWEFHRSREAKKADDRLQSAPATGAAQQPKTPAGTSAAAPVVPRGAVVLQVAALSREPDAYALAEALQKKDLPAFVLRPAGDSLYRVQVGPFADEKSAEAGRRLLEREGFKAITKR